MFTLRRLVPALVLALAAAGCAGSVDEARTAPASRPVARVIGDLDAEASTMRVAVDIAGLEAPADVAPDAEAFVVWVREDASRPWGRLGNLAYDPATRNATLPGVVVDGTAFELLVTAEAELAPVVPSRWVLFAQAVKA